MCMVESDRRVKRLIFGGSLSTHKNHSTLWQRLSCSPAQESLFLQRAVVCVLQRENPPERESLRQKAHLQRRIRDTDQTCVTPSLSIWSRALFFALSFNTSLVLIVFLFLSHLSASFFLLFFLHISLMHFLSLSDYLPVSYSLSFSLYFLPFLLFSSLFRIICFLHLLSLFNSSSSYLSIVFSSFFF